MYYGPPAFQQTIPQLQFYYQHPQSNQLLYHYPTQQVQQQAPYITNINQIDPNLNLYYPFGGFASI